MSVSTITVAGNSVNLVSLPSFPVRSRTVTSPMPSSSTMPSWGSLKSVQLNFEDAIAVVKYPFSGQTQTQSWPGADMWSGMVELPPLTQSQLDVWKAFLMQCRGMQNAFMLGDPLKTSPSGTVTSSSAPLCIGTDLAAAQQVATNGWKPSQFRLLLPGDYIQIGMRLHVVLQPVNSDSGGNATIAIWPSLREAPTAGEPIVMKNPQGLFRRGRNKDGWTTDATRLSALSFPVMEYR